MADDYEILRTPIDKPEWDAPARPRWPHLLLGVVGFWCGAQNWYASRPRVAAAQALLGFASIGVIVWLFTLPQVTGYLVALGWGAQFVLFALLLWALVDIAMTVNDGRGRPLEWKPRP